MTSRSGAEIRASENQSKFIQNRITEVEKHFGDLCETFGGYSRKISRVRDKGDEVGKVIMTYSDNESLNHTTKSGLKDFAEYFSTVQDYRETQIKRLDAKVIAPLTTYGQQCKNAKARLKQAFSAREKEVKQQKKLETMKDKKPSDRHNISKAEMDLHQAAVDATDCSKRLENEMDSFEKKKLADIKAILVDFVNVELLFHAKAVEMYTMCFQALTSMDEEEDLEEFRNSLRPASAQSQRLAKMRSNSHTSLNSTGQSAHARTSSSRATPSPTPSQGSRGRGVMSTPTRQPRQTNGYGGGGGGGPSMNNTLQTTQSSLQSTSMYSTANLSLNKIG